MIHDILSQKHTQTQFQTHSQSYNDVHRAVNILKQERYTHKQHGRYTYDACLMLIRVRLW